MSHQTQPVRVLYIAGTGRSGTTIFSNLLGQVPGCLAAGEVRYAWERGLLQNHRCGCGEPFDRCPLWTVVMAEAFPSGPPPDVASRARRLDRRIRVRQLPRMLLRHLRGLPAHDRHPDDADILRLYSALSAQPGVHTIVDSSKSPPYGMLLASLPGIELHVAHVVRDPRANAFSWRRTKTTRDTDERQEMDRLEVWRSAVLWVLFHWLIPYWWPARSGSRILVRYEDLVQDPAATLDAVLKTIDASLPPDVLDGRFVTLAPTHSVAGNPARHDTGAVELRVDDEWCRKMPLTERLLVTAITAPLLHRFGYSARAGLSRRAA